MYEYNEIHIYVYMYIYKIYEFYNGDRVVPKNLYKIHTHTHILSLLNTIISGQHRKLVESYNGSQTTHFC